MYKISPFSMGITRCCLVLMLLIISVLNVEANKNDTIRFNYKINSAVIDTSFKDNSKAISRLDSILNSQTIDTIYITSSASPDGTKHINENLRHLRSQAIINHIKQHYKHLSDVHLAIRNAPIEWSRLAYVLHSDSTANISDNIYHILYDNTLSEIRKQRKLNTHKATYAKIAKRWLPELRYAECSVHHKNTKTKTEVLIPDTIVATPTYNTTPITPEAINDTTVCVQEYSQWHLSTNAAYWLALAHNAGVTYDIDDCRDLSLNVACAWWSNKAKHRVYRWMMAETVYRRYLHKAIPHQGWFVGGHAQTGLFEMMFSAKNRKGEFVGGGLSSGYSWNLSNKLSLTTELGLGYMFVKYRYARDINGTLIRQGNNTYHYFGPTRLAVSLTYNFLKTRKVK